MLINFDELSNNQTYHVMTQTILPRPIAWVLTQNDDDSFNIAPFSYFNAVCSDPALLMISIGYKSDGSDKDTIANLKKRQHATVHIASYDNLIELNQSAAELAYGESEINASNIPLRKQSGFHLPIVDNIAVAYDCTLYELQKIGNHQQNIVYLQAHQIFIDDKHAHIDDKQRINVNAQSVNPLARLGGAQYACLGDVISRKRGV